MKWEIVNFFTKHTMRKTEEIKKEKWVVSYTRLYYNIKDLCNILFKAGTQAVPNVLNVVYLFVYAVVTNRREMEAISMKKQMVVPYPRSNKECIDRVWKINIIKPKKTRHFGQSLSVPCSKEF